MEDKERRFRIGVISVNEVSNHTKENNASGFIEALKARLPDGTTIISQETDMSTASLRMLLHNPKFDLVKLGAEIETFVIKLGEPKKVTSSIIQLAH